MDAALLSTPSANATICALPSATAVTRPVESTVAIAESLDAHVKEATVAAVLSAWCAVALSCTVAPTDVNVSAAGATATDATRCPTENTTCALHAPWQDGATTVTVSVPKCAAVTAAESPPANGVTTRTLSAPCDQARPVESTDTPSKPNARAETTICAPIVGRVAAPSGAVMRAPERPTCTTPEVRTLSLAPTTSTDTVALPGRAAVTRIESPFASVWMESTDGALLVHDSCGAARVSPCWSSTLARNVTDWPTTRLSAHARAWICDATLFLGLVPLSWSQAVSPASITIPASVRRSGLGIDDRVMVSGEKEEDGRRFRLSIVVPISGFRSTAFSRRFPYELSGNP